MVKHIISVLTFIFSICPKATIPVYFLGDLLVNFPVLCNPFLRQHWHRISGGRLVHWDSVEYLAWEAVAIAKMEVHMQALWVAKCESEEADALRFEFEAAEYFDDSFARLLEADDMA